MADPRMKLALASAALILALASAALGTRTARPLHSDEPAAALTPRAIEPFALAALLAEAPPDVVVIAMDEARHPLRGAQPLASFGGSDDALLKSAPRGRRVVLAAFDVVRQDRIARRLAGAGRNVQVLASGLGGWDHAMDADPEAPATPTGPTSEAQWRTYRMRVALRRSFGDAAPSLAAPVAAPIAPAGAAAAGDGAPKKREGC